MSRRNGFLPRFSFQSALVTIVVIAILVLVAYVVGKMSSSAKVQYINSQVVAPATKAQEKLNKSFDFAVKDAKGITITKIKYTLETASLQNQLIIQGQKASAIQGKTFLIINFSLANSSNKYIQLNSRDYVRLIGANGAMIAPDIHNDPIQIQPISTKESRLGFPVDDGVNKFSLSVGEIDGSKTTIQLNF